MTPTITYSSSDFVAAMKGIPLHASAPGESHSTLVLAGQARHLLGHRPDLTERLIRRSTSAGGFDRAELDHIIQVRHGDQP